MSSATVTQSIYALLPRQTLPGVANTQAPVSSGGVYVDRWIRLEDLLDSSGTAIGGATNPSLSISSGVMYVDFDASGEKLFLGFVVPGDYVAGDDELSLHIVAASDNSGASGVFSVTNMQQRQLTDTAASSISTSDTGSIPDNELAHVNIDLTDAGTNTFAPYDIVTLELNLSSVTASQALRVYGLFWRYSSNVSLIDADER